MVEAGKLEAIIRQQIFGEAGDDDQPLGSREEWQEAEGREEPEKINEFIAGKKCLREKRGMEEDIFGDFAGGAAQMLVAVEAQESAAEMGHQDFYGNNEIYNS